MGLFLIYMLKVAICMLLFFAFNKLVLSKDTYHTFNRIAWLFVAIISLSLPLVEWHGFEPISADIELMATPSVAMDMSNVALDRAEDTSINIFVIVRNIFIVYVLFATLLFIKLSLSYIRLFAFIIPKREVLATDKKYYELLDECMKIVGIKRNIHFVIHNEAMSPFSWMSYIVVSREDLEENGKDILIHELAHSKHLHSYDLLLADILIIFQWFNPAAWLYKESLQQVHEYKADESVLQCGINAKQYQLLLIRKAVGQRLYSMANSFNHSKLKNRITMMLKEKSNKWAFAKCLYALPLAFIAVSAFASDEVSTRFEEISDVKFTQIIENGDALESDNVKKDSSNVKKDTPFIVVENMPKFQGGDLTKFKNWVNSKVIQLLKSEYAIHPDLAKVGKARGNIIIEFVVEEDGSVADITVIRSSIKSISDDVVSIVKSSPKWTPGKQSGNTVRVKYTLPILYMTNKTSEDAKVHVHPVIMVSEKQSFKAGVKGKSDLGANKLKVYKKDAPYIVVEKMPKFQDGDLSKFRSWVMSKIVYPEQAVKSEIQGLVIVEFAVEVDGKLGAIKVVKSPDASLSDEMVRILKSSPKWTPGSQSGKVVRVKYTMPINFKLPNKE